MKKIVGLGANVLDTLISSPSFPKKDTKMKADAVTVCGGGPVGNALIIASKLGISAEAVGSFADDAAGERIRAELEDFGVSTKECAVSRGAKSFVSYIILSEKDGSRTCLYNRGTVADDAENVNLSSIDTASILHLDGNYMKCAVKAARYAKEKGVTVSLDAGGLYDGIEELLPLVDILIPSAEFAMGITKTDSPIKAIAELWKRYSPKILAVTSGADGGYYIKDGEIIKYESFKIIPKDTNGAGDTFHGAFLAAYLDGLEIGECCRFASATSAYKCLHSGVRSFELSKNIIFDFIKEQGGKNQ
ncbi:MAG: hypothetical protein E7612_00550 [Ruminococcaceae bacterium]|nr:hypothetical protein [Oscillospiraceae bacterium]